MLFYKFTRIVFETRLSPKENAAEVPPEGCQRLYCANQARSAYSRPVSQPEQMKPALQKYRTTNWKTYNEALKARGLLPSGLIRP